MPLYLPKTRARIPSSIEIYLVDPASNQSKQYLIGGITEFSLRMSRATTRRFEIDSDFPGKSVEIIPGKLNNLSITVRRAIFYNNLKDLYGSENPPTTTKTDDYASSGDWMELLKKLNISSSIDIIEQIVPFTIIEKRYDPPQNLVSNNEINQIGNPSRIIAFEDCLITDVPYSYNIEGDWLILQEATIEVGRIREI